MDSLIEVTQLSKKYQIGKKLPYYSLRDSVVDFFQHDKNKNNQNEFWALKKVSFEIEKGEIVGIIGRNGAGKSTLLKILSRITTPTVGDIVLRGRVVSLLEIGTGFHPELTGRENIFLNGAILGMPQSEIKLKYDKIVEFSEIKDFMDTPVKFYSSGMYVRLAFAVAAHLESEILIVDEVLAVGDIAFQKKCLAKMNEISKDGRTVIFVSHNLAAIESLCSRCLVINRGMLVFDSDQHTAVDYYLKSLSKDKKVDIRNWKDREGTGDAKVTEFKVMTLDNNESEFLKPGEPFKIRMNIKFKKALTVNIGIDFESSGQWPIFTTQMGDSLPIEKINGEKTFEVIIDPSPFREGYHPVTLRVLSPERRIVYDCLYHVPAFQIQGHDAKSGFPVDYRPGELYFKFNWKRLPPKL